MKKALKPLFSIVLLVHCLRLIFAELPALPAGTDWSQYIMGSEVIWNFDSSLHYPAWRKPLYSYLLGLFGTESYLHSGHILASLGFCCSLGAIAVWFWRKSWFLSLVLMLSFSLHPLVLDGMNYLNPYPLMGGFVMLGAALSLKDKTGKLSLLGGGAGVGAAITLDGRAWVVLVFISLFFLWKRYSAQKWIFWFLGMLPIFMLSSWLMSSFQLQLLSLTDQLWEQRAFLFREDMEYQLFPFHKDNALVAGYCVGESQYITREWFSSDCMNWLASTNWSSIQRIGILPSWGGLLGLFALTAWKPRLHSFWGLVIISLVFSLLLWAPPRYYFLSVGALFILLGEACLVLGKRAWIQAIICVGFSWFWFYQASPFHSKDYPREWEVIMPKLLSAVGENQLLDCSQKDIWLVHSSSSRDPQRSLFVSEQQCLEILKTGRFSFLLFPEEKGYLLSKMNWKEKERFQIHRDSIVLFRKMGL